MSETRANEFRMTPAEMCARARLLDLRRQWAERGITPSDEDAVYRSLLDDVRREVGKASPSRTLQ